MLLHLEESKIRASTYTQTRKVSDHTNTAVPVETGTQGWEEQKKATAEMQNGTSLFPSYLQYITKAER